MRSRKIKLQSLWKMLGEACGQHYPAVEREEVGSKEKDLMNLSLSSAASEMAGVIKCSYRVVWEMKTGTVEMETADEEHMCKYVSLLGKDFS